MIENYEVAVGESGGFVVVVNVAFFDVLNVGIVVFVEVVNDAFVVLVVNNGFVVVVAFVVVVDAVNVAFVVVVLNVVVVKTSMMKLS